MFKVRKSRSSPLIPGGGRAVLFLVPKKTTLSGWKTEEKEISSAAQW